MFEHFHQVEIFFKSRKKHGMKPGLDRMHKLLKLLDNPQEEVKAIHVAGTNGKGSTIQYLKNALIFNGYHVGVFTSPSLEGLIGYISIDNEMIPEIEFTKLANDIYPYIQQLDDELNHPTEFEIITVIAFMYFAEYVDIALIETGMGGREDTTNCFLPILSIITNVEQDHTAFLGESFESIAYHKAGIIKENIPVVLGEMSEEALTIVSKEASVKNAQLYQLTIDFDYSIINDAPLYQIFDWISSSNQKLEVSIQTTGRHQVKNASLAIMALKLLGPNHLTLDWGSSLKGLYHTQIPGRFELVRNNPVIVLDGAHNPAGVHAFVETLTTKYKYEEKHLIFAAFKDKDLPSMLNDLVKYFSTIILTTFDHPRAASAEDLQLITSHENVRIIHDWKEAVGPLSCREDGSCYFVTGSLYFIANVRKYFELK